MIIHGIVFDCLSGRQEHGNMIILVTLREDSVDTHAFCKWCHLHGIATVQDVAYSKTDKWLIRYVRLQTPQQQVAFKLTWYTGTPLWPQELT